jgi:hypothetical protein
MLDWTFSRLTTELLEILRDRYPNGLAASTEQPEPTTPVPASDTDVRLAYALPKNPNDLSEGWKNLKAQPDDTLGKKGLRDLCHVAFALLDADADEADAEFRVEVPVLEDYEEE